MAVTEAQVQQLYVGYLGRPADRAGLDYWLDELNAENPVLTLENLRSNFVNEQPEYTEAYAGLNRQQTVTQIYENVFGRTPSDNEVAYWTVESEVNTDQLITAFLDAASPTDRLIVNNKVAIAQQVTSAFAGTTLTGADLTSQLAQAASAYAIESTTANGQTTYSMGGNTFTSLNAATNAALVQARTDFGSTFDSSASTTLAPNFYGTSANIVLNNVPDSTTITLANQPGGNLRDVTITGAVGAAGATSSTLTLSTAAGTTEAPADPTVTTNITALTFGLRSNTTVELSELTDLMSIDATGSTGNLTIDASDAGFTQLAALLGGSGNDTLITGAVAAGGTLDVAGGAGRDTITLVSGEGVLNVDAGDGNDIVNLTAGAAASDEAHSTTITLGAGNDRLVVASLENLAGDNLGVSATSTAAQIQAANDALAAHMVTVVDFSTAQDVISFSGLTFAAFNNIQLGEIQASGSLAEALSLVSGGLGAATAASFTHGGDTYIYTDNANAGVDAGDGLIQLVGVNSALSLGGNLLVTA